jgi:hypothetical protein
VVVVVAVVVRVALEEARVGVLHGGAHTAAAGWLWL